VNPSVNVAFRPRMRKQRRARGRGEEEGGKGYIYMYVYISCVCMGRSRYAFKCRTSLNPSVYVTFRPKMREQKRS